MTELPAQSKTVRSVDATPVGADEILPEYDFSKGMRNKHTSQIRAAGESAYAPNSGRLRSRASRSARKTIRATGRERRGCLLEF